MSDILSDSELEDIANGYFTEMRPNEIRERLLATCRALAAERDNLKEVNQGIIDGIKDGKAILGERIRTLESACEAALKWFANEPGFPRNSSIVKQLEGAIKHG